MKELRRDKKNTPINREKEDIKNKKFIKKSNLRTNLNHHFILDKNKNKIIKK